MHSSIEALTSSKRGAENDRDIVPEKSSIGLISSRISASPERACGSPDDRAAQASLPTSQSNDSVWMARRLGTSRCSVIRPKETRRGAKALDVRLVFAGREDGKMRPSEDLWCRTAVSRAPRWAPSTVPAAGKAPKSGQRAQGSSRKAAQTSSLAGRAAAVQPHPQERRDGLCTAAGPGSEPSFHGAAPKAASGRNRTLRKRCAISVPNLTGIVKCSGRSIPDSCASRPTHRLAWSR